MSDYLDPNNEELLKDFFMEAQSQVDLLEQNVLVLETDPTNKDAIDEIFRAAHTLKGGSSTVQMMDIASFTHVVEDLLDEIRDGKQSMDGELVDLLLSAIDLIKGMLQARLDGTEFSEDTEPVKKALESRLGGKGAPPAPAPEKPTPKPKAQKSAKKGQAGVAQFSEYELLELKEASDGKAVLQIKIYFDEDNPMNSVGGIQVFAALKEIGTVLKTNPDFDDLYDDNFFPEVDYFVTLKTGDVNLEQKLNIPDVTTGFDIFEVDFNSNDKAKSSQPVQEVQKSAPTAKEPDKMDQHEKISESIQEATKEPPASSSQERTKPEAKKNVVGSVLRVESKRIDNLLNLVSETVINKATFNQISNQFSDDLLTMQTQGGLFKDKLRDLFEILPEYLDEMKSGTAVKDIKKKMYEEFGDLLTAYDQVENSFKNTFGTFRNTSQNLGRIIGELHEGVLRIRMVPISQIFSRFPRLVRDLSKTLTKKVQLKIEGEETELDKSVIEDLLDPLIHCVRNSLDHGIENPKDRLVIGKREEGVLLLKASNEGNMIVIEISDDGAGIDVENIKAKAVERGLLHPNKNLTDVEAFNLIFEPGFSTAKKVTNISGRGVGLDVVRKQIEKLNGSVSIWSEKGKGTKFTIKLPLTLAIIQGLLVKVGEEIYAIPITSVIDSHRIKPSEIKVIDNYEVFNVRKDVISIMRLNTLFGIKNQETTDYTFIVVVGSGDKKMGLMVDSLIGEEDVVIKPLKDIYTNSPGIAGATILGNGKVSLIIDVGQLLDLGLKNERAARNRRDSLLK